MLHLSPQQVRGRPEGVPGSSPHQSVRVDTSERSAAMTEWGKATIDKSIRWWKSTRRRCGWGALNKGVAIVAFLYYSSALVEKAHYLLG